MSRLHRLKNGLLELTLDLLARLVGGGLAVEREQVAEVELGGLEELDLADVDLKIIVRIFAHYDRDDLQPFSTYVAQGVDALGSLLHLTAHNLRNELGGELAEGAAGSLP